MTKIRKIRKKDFIIKSRRTGNRLAGKENEVVYEIFTADGTKEVQGGFYRWKDADSWLSKNVKLANMMIANGMIANRA